MTDKELIEKILHFFYHMTWPVEYEAMRPMIEERLNEYVPKFLSQFKKEGYIINIIKQRENGEYK